MNRRSHPELHGFNDFNVYNRAYHQKRGKENQKAGLTWKGKERKYKFDPALADIHGKARKLIRNQQRAERFMAQGLTWRGTIRKKRWPNQVTPIEKLYREISAEVVLGYGRENYA